MSFLDLLSCALGGILVLWLLSIRQSQQEAASYAGQAHSMQRQIAEALAALRIAQRAAAAKARPRPQQKTIEGLQAAFALTGVDTVTLMSDGRAKPSGTHEMAETRTWLAQVNRPLRAVVNCVALGDYFGKHYAEFLQKIARDDGTMFIGR